jgi:hypothetical protein
MGLGSVFDWPSLYQKILTHLVPGSGWFESVEIDWQPRCDDGTLQQGILTDWWEVYLKPQFAAVNRRLDYDPSTGDMLRAAGFQDIQHAVYRLPMHPWSDDRSEHRVGIWWRTCMSSSAGDNGNCFGLEAMSLAALCRINSWTVEHVKRLCNDALKQAMDPAVHAYNNLHVWWARAPDAGET